MNALLAGLVFGAGLVVAGMTDPARVLGFLDPFGGWDPTLAFVLGGAVAVYAIAWRLLRRSLSIRRDIDVPLIAGAAIFGIGWGLGGLCPGPAVVSLGAGRASALVFVAAMLAGMGLARRLDAVLLRAR